MRFASGAAVLAALSFLSACGSGSVSAPTAVAPPATPPATPPPPPPPPSQEVIACARGVPSEWRGGNMNYFLKTAPENIPVPRELFADLGSGENPTWNSISLFYESRGGQSAFNHGQVAFGSNSRGGNAPGPSLRDPDTFTVALRHDGTVAPLTVGSPTDPHALSASSEHAAWLTGLDRCEDGGEGCPLQWDLAFVRHFDGGEIFADCP